MPQNCALGQLVAVPAMALGLVLTAGDVLAPLNIVLMIIELVAGIPQSKKKMEHMVFQLHQFWGQTWQGIIFARKSTGPSESAFMENKTHPTGLDDGMPSSSQPSSGYQNNWAAKPGNVSMAYIVKMGKPQGKTSNTSFVPGDMPYTSHNRVVPSMSHQSVSRSTTKVLPAEADVEFHCSQGPVIEDAEVGHELGTTQGQHGDWSPVEESTIHETPYASTHHANLSMSSTLHDDEADLQLNPHVDEIHALEGNIAGHNLPSQSFRFASATDEQIQVDSPEDDFEVIDTLIETMAFYPTQRHVYGHEEGESGSYRSPSASFTDIAWHQNPCSCRPRLQWFRCFGAPNLPGGFFMNPSTTVASALMGFEEALSMQYKEGSQYIHPISRPRTQCGRREPVREQCQPFRQAPFTAFKDGGIPAGASSRLSLGQWVT